MKGKLTRNMSAQMMAGSEGGGKEDGERGRIGMQLKEMGDITMVTYRPLSFSLDST